MVFVIALAKLNKMNNMKEVLRLCNDYNHGYHNIWIRFDIWIHDYHKFEFVFWNVLYAILQSCSWIQR